MLNRSLRDSHVDQKVKIWGDRDGNILGEYPVSKPKGARRLGGLWHKGPISETQSAIEMQNSQP